jgi:hypothetical protein
MFNQHGLAVNEKPQVVGCWPVFTHANVAAGIMFALLPKRIRIGVHVPDE